MIIDIERQNDVCVLHCKGRFIAGPDLEYMQSKMDEIKKLNCRRVLVDLREVPAIGSMGVSLIVGVYTSVIRKPSGRFVLAGAGAPIQHVLDLTGLSTVIPQASDLASGLAMLRADAPMDPKALSKNVPAN